MNTRTLVSVSVIPVALILMFLAGRSPRVTADTIDVTQVWVEPGRSACVNISAGRAATARPQDPELTLYLGDDPSIGTSGFPQRPEYGAWINRFDEAGQLCMAVVYGSSEVEITTVPLKELPR